MRNKVLACVAVIAGFAGLAAMPTAALASHSHHQARTAGTCPSGTSVPAYCTCPSGTSVSAYCTCPSGTSVSAYCTCPAGDSVSGYCTVSPGGSPTVYDKRLWKFLRVAGPKLKFSLKRGLDGAANLKSCQLILPAGVTFPKALWSKPSISAGKFGWKFTTSTLTITLRKSAKSFAVQLNSQLHASKALRKAFAKGTLKYLTFRVKVTDAEGITTKLAFRVTPQG